MFIACYSTNGPISVDHDAAASSSVARVRPSRRSTTPTSPHGSSVPAVTSSSSTTNSHRHRRANHRTHHRRSHPSSSHTVGGSSAVNSTTVVPVPLAAANSLASGVVFSLGRLVTTGSVYHGPVGAETVGVCRSRSGSLSPPDTGRSRSQGSSCSGSHR